MVSNVVLDQIPQPAQRELQEINSLISEISALDPELAANIRSLINEEGVAAYKNSPYPHMVQSARMLGAYDPEEFPFVREDSFELEPEQEEA